MKLPYVPLLVLTWMVFQGHAFCQNVTIAQSGTVAIVNGRTLINVLPERRPVPYSADQEVESTRTLVDGTHIVARNHSRVYRDSLGRTRYEAFATERLQMIVGSQAMTSINIYDPVERVQYFLNPTSHTGTSVKFPNVPDPPDNSPAPRLAAVSPVPKDVLPQTKEEDLGMDMVDGVWAHGTRMTVTIPANAEGNDRPIVSVSERWTSDELQTDILIKTSDPRNGEYTQRLTNIDRSEPDPALFRPPADYVVTESPR